MGVLAEEPARQVIVVAPTAFKGTLRPTQAARAIAAGIRRVLPDAKIVLIPVADGGDGTREVLAPDAPLRTVRVHDPRGRMIEAGYAFSDETAIIETAEASGLRLLLRRERDPETTSTFGTGQLILAAWKAGARRILLGAGGSATVDGGRGALEAIGDPKKICPAITVLCDVTTRYMDAPKIFGPQKGASPEAVGRLEEKLDAWNETLPRNVLRLKGGGAAGGLAGGLAAFGAKLAPGAPFVLRHLRFARRIRGADLLITGEGRFDETSTKGKIVGEVLARSKGIPRIIVCGESSINRPDVIQMALLAGSRRRATRAPTRWLCHATEVALRTCR